MKAKVLSFQHFFYILIILYILSKRPENCVEAQATINCKYNQYIVEDILGKQSCVPCPNCTVGYGLTPECGSFIKYGSKFECKACIDGISYSTSNGIGSCQPCGICTDHQTVISKCNKTHNSKCGNSCEKGFYYSSITFDCQKCSWCCAGSGVNPVKDCEVSGVPFYKRCSADDSLGCQPRCSDKQFVFVDKTLKKTCINCHSCGTGKGLYPKCSKVITDKSEPKCLPCVLGKTFSDVTDSSSCKPCTKCDFGKKIERLCNVTHNTLCGDCMHGFYTNKVGDKKSCKACSYCCGDKLDVRVPECKDQGMPTDQQCAYYTERAVTKCKPPSKSNILAISLGSGVTAFVVLCFAALVFYYYSKIRNIKYGQLVETPSDTLMTTSSGSRQSQERPSRGSNRSVLKFLHSGVKVRCEAPEIGQELLGKMSAEVCWDYDCYPKIKEREVLLSPVMKLNPQGFKVQETFKLNLPHSAHYDDENQFWSIVVLKSNNPYDDSPSSEWTDLSTLRDIVVDKGSVEFSEDELGTYVVVGTPGEDQTLSKKRMCCAVFGMNEPRTGQTYSINLYLLDDCEPSFVKMKNEEELDGRHMMASLRLFHPDVHPESVVNINIENVSDGWSVGFMPKKFTSYEWVDSYRRNLKVEAVFEHVDTNKQDFRCLFKVKFNDTTCVEIPVWHYFDDCMPEPLLTSIQASNQDSSDVTPLLEFFPGTPTPGIAVPLSSLSNDQLTELSQSVDANSVESFARRIIPDITDREIQLICTSANPFISMIDMANRRNPPVTVEEFDAALKQGAEISQGTPEQQSPHGFQNGDLLV